MGCQGRLLRGYLCREATIYLYRSTGWVSTEGTWDAPRIFLGCPGPLGMQTRRPCTGVRIPKVETGKRGFRGQKIPFLNSVHTRGIAKKRGFLQGVFVKSGILLNLKVFLWNSYRTGDPEKSKTPRKSPEKWTFLSLAFYNAPSLHTVKFPSAPEKGVLSQKIPIFLVVPCKEMGIF